MKNNFLLSVIVPVYNEKKTFFILTKKLLKLKIKKIKLEIIIMNSNGTEQKQLTQNDAWEGMPNWGPLKVK